MRLAEFNKRVWIVSGLKKKHSKQIKLVSPQCVVMHSQPIYFVNDLAALAFANLSKQGDEQVLGHMGTQIAHVALQPQQ